MPSNIFASRTAPPPTQQPVVGQGMNPPMGVAPQPWGNPVGAHPISDPIRISGPGQFGVNAGGQPLNGAPVMPAQNPYAMNPGVNPNLGQLGPQQMPQNQNLNFLRARLGMY